MADRLGITQQQMADLARSGEPTKISSMCTVFAESEVISLIGRGEPRENIARGVIDSVVSRVATHGRAGRGRPVLPDRRPVRERLRGGAVGRATGVAGDHLAPGSLCRSDRRGHSSPGAHVRGGVIRRPLSAPPCVYWEELIDL